VVQEVRRAYREDIFQDAVDEMCVREHLTYSFFALYDPILGAPDQFFFLVPWAMEVDSGWKF
jgi:hypothetical protein